MLKLAVKVEARKAVRATRRILKRIPVVTAQELNTQRRQSRTRMTRRLSSQVNVRPQKRIRRRILLPRPGNATPRRLKSSGITMFSTVPGRYFTRGLVGGARYVVEPEGTPDKRGRRTQGGAFEATMPSGYTSLFRRLGRRRLPIRDARVVSLEGPGYAIRMDVLRDLAKEWPARWTKRMRRETKRIFGR